MIKMYETKGEDFKVLCEKDQKCEVFPGSQYIFKHDLSMQAVCQAACCWMGLKKMWNYESLSHGKRHG